MAVLSHHLTCRSAFGLQNYWVFKIMLVNNIEKLGRSGIEMEVSGTPVETDGWTHNSDSLLELSGGHLLLTRHSILHAHPHHLASGPLIPCLHHQLVVPAWPRKIILCFDVCYRIMTKASFKTQYCSSWKLRIWHLSTLWDFHNHSSLTSMSLRIIKALGWPKSSFRFFCKMLWGLP